MDKFTLDKCFITDERWKECEDKNARFLSLMDPQRVLAGFRRTAGIETDAKPYGGWEDSLIAGHGTGHYFSALGMHIAYIRGREEYRDDLEISIRKAETIVAGLKECQEKLGSGFLSAAAVQDENNPYIQFDVLENKAEGEQWVPWYALHKVLQGLMDLWTYTGIKDAKEVTLSLADWVKDRVLAWDSDTRKKVLSVEYGGMNDTLYRLFLLTNNKDYLKAAEVFDEPELYKDLLSFRNRLSGVHANATIPKVLGYLTGAAAFEKAGEMEKAKTRVELAESFWDKIISCQTYATGGIGDMEHFFPDGLLDASRTQCNAESCCCYNMMKLSSELFMRTGKTKYTDYIEKTLWNAKLGSVGPDGGYTYFNPMATGYYRLYSPNEPKDNPFWCCVGTAMEDFTSVADKIFYYEASDLYIAQWISADINAGGQIFKLKVDYSTGKLSIKACGEGARIRLRIPRWVSNRASILKDNEETLNIDLKAGETFELDFKMDIKVTGLPDERSAKGFTYGPFVLCVPLGNEKWGISESAGIDVYAPAWKVVFDSAIRCNINYGKTGRAVSDREYLTLPEGETIESFSADPSRFIRKDKDDFLLTGFKNSKGEEITLKLIPYNKAGNERYGIYWYLV